MPIEIKELVVKATVSNRASNGARSNNSADADQPALSENTDEIIALCVEQVLQILKDKEES